MSKQAEIYAIVTDRLTNQMKDGKIPWAQPWTFQAGKFGDITRHVNIVTRKPYQGFNMLITMSSGFASPFWGTYNQWKQAGACVRKGEKGTPIVFWKPFEKIDPKTGEKKKSFILRYSSIFNALQVDELPACFMPIETPTTEDAPIFNPIDACETIVANMPLCPPILHEGDAACYYRVTDTVKMPQPIAFKSNAEYYHTLFHELAHSTGHPSRLDRFAKEQNHFVSFGSEPYSKEELVAEMTAAFVSHVAGIGAPIVKNSAAYLQSWLRKFKDDPSMLVWAAGRATKAADYILGEKPVEAKEEETE